MTDWSDRVGQLLLDGETVRESVSVGTGAVYVTSHRVLAFPPGDGPNFRAIERPNAVGAERTAVSDRDLLSPALRTGVVAVVLLGGGLVLAPEELLPMPDLSADGPAADLLGPVQTMLRLFYALDDLMLAGGALAAVAAVVLAGLQVRSRTEYVVLEVAGDDDVRLPAATVDDATVERLDAALALPDGTDRAPPGRGRDGAGDAGD